MAPRPQQPISQDVAWPAPFHEHEAASVRQRVAFLLPRSGPPLLVRIIWYLAIGWWLAGLVAALAYALALTVIGLPLALVIFNRIPAVLTLRPASRTMRLVSADGMTFVQVRGMAQRSFLLRAIYFVAIGWWLAGIWLGIAYLLQLTIVGIPLGLLMLNRIGGVLTLYRY